ESDLGISRTQIQTWQGENRTIRTSRTMGRVARPTCWILGGRRACLKCRSGGTVRCTADSRGLRHLLPDGEQPVPRPFVVRLTAQSFIVIRRGECVLLGGGVQVSAVTERLDGLLRVEGNRL